ncbi:MAG: TadE/TadG family type IV pilus assembly protein [Actinomycetota bacterium]
MGRALRSERGVAALEFAIVAQLLFLLLYGMIMYGMIFLVDHSITQAAAEGARYAISQPTSSPTFISDVIKDTRSHIAFAEAQKWATVDAAVIDCPADPSVKCIHVTISYDNRAHLVIPGFVGMQYLTPATIGAESTVELT